MTLIEIRPPRCADTSNSRKGFLKRYTRGYHKRFSGSPEGDIIEVLDRFKGDFDSYWFFIGMMQKDLTRISKVFIFLNVHLTPDILLPCLNVGIA